MQNFYSHFPSSAGSRRICCQLLTEECVLSTGKLLRSDSLFMRISDHRLIHIYLHQTHKKETKALHQSLKKGMCLVMRKLLFAYEKTKAQISCAVTAQVISTFVFTTQIVQFLYCLNAKFQASNHLLWPYLSDLVRNLEDMFSPDTVCLLSDPGSHPEFCFIFMFQTDRR